MFSEYISDKVEWNIPKALSRIDDPRAAMALVSGLSTNHRHIHINTADILAKKPDTRAIPVLIDAGTSGQYAGDASVKVRYAAALKSITGQDFGTDFAKWKAWWSENKGKMR